jgi:hypothetical protein
MGPARKELSWKREKPGNELNKECDQTGRNLAGEFNKEKE